MANGRALATSGPTLSLIEFVLLANLAAEEILRFEGMRVELLQRPAPTSKPAGRPTGAGTRQHPHREAELTKTLLALELEARARQTIERRFLGGHDVLFPAVAARWTALTSAVRGAAGSGVAGRRTHGSVAAVQARAAELTELAEAAAYPLMGDSETAARTAERRRQAGRRD